MSQVILFSTSSCPWCKRAKRYLKENRVRYKEVNIDFKSYYTKSALPGTFRQRWRCAVRVGKKLERRWRSHDKDIEPHEAKPDQVV